MAKVKALLLWLGRLLLAVHFAGELYQKIFRYDHWLQVIKTSGQPFPEAEMALIVVLLSYGVPMLIIGACLRPWWAVPSASLALCIYQVVFL